MTQWLDASELLQLGQAGGYSNLVSLRETSSVFLLSAMPVIKQRWLWQDPVDPLTDAQWDAITDYVESVEAELMGNMSIGMIFWSVALLTDDNVAIMAGQTLPQAEYPDLTGVVPGSWLVGTDIQLPDMRQAGLFAPQGLGGVGLFTGANSVALTVDQMPSHTHPQNPHSHLDNTVLDTPLLATPGPEPVSFVLPTTVTTGATTAINQNTGGDQPHPNVQRSLQALPYLVVR